MDAGPGRADLLVADGLDVATGTYLTPPRTLGEIADALRGTAAPPPDARRLRRRTRDDERHLGVAVGFDPQDLASVGWGLVTAPGLDPAVLAALEPLVARRRAQAGDRFRHLEVLPGESADELLLRYGALPHVVDPRLVPYYLLLVGGPSGLPFALQYQLGVVHAVGRLDLPRADAYAAYAASVLAAEDRDGAGPGERRRTVRVFGPRHDDDVPTDLSSRHLLAPLADELAATASAWSVASDTGDAATKAALVRVLSEPDGPDVLFTAGHGIGGPQATALGLGGALVCQDWPGPVRQAGPLTPTQYLAAADVVAGVPVRPRVVLAFACFGAGTPRWSDYPDAPGAAPLEIAPEPATAPLPARLLGHPDGGALAFVGHVDRTWSCSFLWRSTVAHVGAFSGALLGLLDGLRVGHALEVLTSRYAALATLLTDRIADAERLGRPFPDADLVALWTAVHDARGFVVLGDPAVRAAPPGAGGLLPR
ncbi:hypothetical protein [Cellulomonas fimi]|uniref:CHAT domain-containing protein n=1 Tax=Cellulomonas fimi (strain ATCC 484 / DSM 20113 / JCM 1341 / CCUG 24087 / LMG 16345 / NBRC 15513 / NCIMB 8980 / NCTC 7547 / NRS-133) TaxID=590998 RepID=F4H4W1_CELFA|nr:hypothetical protein [Cellulomonas fimi]AEE45441.1 hypothetical protein Celf_1306 [Cellulomonas fimi ATCC 484]NNH06807.1 hypothetical protein [Cellulomonas fimi]VEH29399.1 Uncharacterised protein [Cellulomonas fimi]